MNYNLPRPAHATKDIAQLEYQLFPNQTTITLEQNDSSTQEASTGRTLWLGAQVLSIYLSVTLKKDVRGTGGRKRKIIIELGSGIGMLALSMLNLGYDVIATDLEIISSGILAKNVEKNFDRRKIYGSEIEGDGGAEIKVRCVDWEDSCKDGWMLQTDSAIKGEQGRINFDYIMTTDSIYHPSLIQPLLKTLKNLSTKSSLIYLALENRDPILIQSFFTQAIEMGFKCSRIDQKRLEKIMQADYKIENGTVQLDWSLEDWEGVEIWKMSWSSKKE